MGEMSDVESTKQSRTRMNFISSHTRLGRFSNWTIRFTLNRYTVGATIFGLYASYFFTSRRIFVESFSGHRHADNAFDFTHTRAGEKPRIGCGKTDFVVIRNRITGNIFPLHVVGYNNHKVVKRYYRYNLFLQELLPFSYRMESEIYVDLSDSLRTSSLVAPEFERSKIRRKSTADTAGSSNQKSNGNSNWWSTTLNFVGLSRSNKTDSSTSLDSSAPEDKVDPVVFTLAKLKDDTDLRRLGHVEGEKLTLESGGNAVISCLMSFRSPIKYVDGTRCEQERIEKEVSEALKKYALSKYREALLKKVPKGCNPIIGDEMIRSGAINGDGVSFGEIFGRTANLSPTSVESNDHASPASQSGFPEKEICEETTREILKVVEKRKVVLHEANVTVCFPGGAFRCPRL